MKTVYFKIVIRYSPFTVERTWRCTHHHGKRLHRTDGPAIHDTSASETFKRWYVDGYQTDEPFIRPDTKYR